MESFTPYKPKEGDIIPNSYIVSVNPKLSKEEFRQHCAWAAGIQARSRTRLGLPNDDRAPTEVQDKFICGDVIKGFSGTFDDKARQELLSQDDVLDVEPNVIVRCAGEISTDPKITEETVKLWALPAISWRGQYDPDDAFVCDESAGEGMDVYVLDSGIRTTHHDLEGRATAQWNMYPEDGDDDVYGHGTHVAGSIAGYKYGVAKRARVISVKVISNKGYGEMSKTIAGLNWVINKATKMSVINMSLHSPYSKVYNRMVDKAVRAGHVCVVAAANKATDSRNFSPASADQAITVGAVDDKFKRTMISCWGPALTLWAPGQWIVSCGIKDDTAKVLMNGTSMACAYTSGVAAYLIAKEKLASPSDVMERLEKLATNNIVKDAGDNSPNLFLYNGGSDSTVTA